MPRLGWGAQELCNWSRSLSTRVVRHFGHCFTHCPVGVGDIPSGRFRLVHPKTSLEMNMFGVLHSDGSGEDNPPLESLSDLYDELSSASREHGDVSVINDDTGWCMSAHRDGRVVVGQLSDTKHDQYMLSVPKAKVIDMWKRLISGDIDGLLEEPWNPGNGP